MDALSIGGLLYGLLVTAYLVGTWIFLASVLCVYAIFRFEPKNMERVIYGQITTLDGITFYFDPLEVYALDVSRLPIPKDFRFKQNGYFGPVFIAEYECNKLGRKIQPDEMVLIIFTDPKNQCVFNGNEYNGRSVKIIAAPFKFLEHRSIPVKK